MKYFILISVLMMSACKSVEIKNTSPDLPLSLLERCAPLPLLSEEDLSLREYYLASNATDVQYAECAVRHNRLVDYLKESQQ